MGILHPIYELKVIKTHPFIYTATEMSGLQTPTPNKAQLSQNYITLKTQQSQIFVVIAKHAMQKMY